MNLFNSVVANKINTHSTNQTDWYFSCLGMGAITGKVREAFTLFNFVQSSEQVRRWGWWKPFTHCHRGDIYLIMEFAVNCLSIRINQLESVWSISIHIPESIWNPSITEQEGNLGNRKMKAKVLQFKSKHPWFLRYSKSPKIP